MLAQSPQIRITRFKDLEPQSGYDSPVDAWRPDGPLTARPVYVLLGPPKPGAVTAAQPVVAVDKGMSLTIVECPPGGMPVLPTFLHTRETFVCLKGRFRVRWGEHGEQETFLDAFDMIALPPSVCRSFVNVTDESAFLLVMLAGQTGERAKEYSPRARAELSPCLSSVRPKRMRCPCHHTGHSAAVEGRGGSGAGSPSAGCTQERDFHTDQCRHRETENVHRGRGDCHWKIADKHRVQGGWEELYAD